MRPTFLFDYFKIMNHHLKIVDNGFKIINNHYKKINFTLGQPNKDCLTV